MEGTQVKNKAGDGIDTATSKWTFDDKKVVQVFDQHVSKSVPFYAEANKQVLSILPFFFTEPITKIVDFGCSTGTLLNTINSTFTDRDLSLYGFDISKQMIEHAQQNDDNSVSFTTDDLLLSEISDVDVYFSMYTLQFIHPKVRLQYLEKIYNSLNWGGGFFIYEKIRAPDARFQDIFTTSYFKYKESQGYDATNIYSKYMSLEGVLEPFSETGNLHLLKEAGFKDITSIFKFAPFQGWLCIK